MTDPTSLPNFPPPPDEHPLRGRVLDALIDQGLAPDIDGDGDVAFTVQDQQLFVRCTEGDFQIMRLFGQWAISDTVPSDPLTRLATCNEITLQMNVVKAGLANDTLVVTSEHIVDQNSNVPSLVNVSVQLVLAGVQMWHERIMGGGGESGPGAGQPAPDGDPA
ncbi:MAG TPA: hypothetical protein VEQ83_04765 [Lapillicoccus sp.]|nr:hypothetical protein [Lapillicoccus sp.]